MSNQTKGNLVDISSNTQVLNLYIERLFYLELRLNFDILFSHQNIH